MRPNLNNQATVEQYLSIVRNFMIQIHQKFSTQRDTNSLSLADLEAIQKAAVKLQTTKEHVNILQKENSQVDQYKLNLAEAKANQSHLEKRLQQKIDEIAVLRETVKTIYGDNEKVIAQKQQLNKELTSMRENYLAIKKKVKKQEEQMHTHREELQNLTSVAEERFQQYAKEQKEKDLLIKKLNNEVERNRHELLKKEKVLTQNKRFAEDITNRERELESLSNIVETLKYENKLLKQEIESGRQHLLQEKQKSLESNEKLLRELESSTDKLNSVSAQSQDLQIRVQSEVDKNQGYENQILVRTEKLKEKSKQVKTYSQEVSRLAERIQELSLISDEFIQENRALSLRCKELEGRLEEVQVLQDYMRRVKDDIHSKKSAELGKLIDSLGRLQSS